MNSTYTQAVFNQAKNGWTASTGSNSFHGSNDSLNSIPINDSNNDSRGKDGTINGLRRQIIELKRQIDLKNRTIMDVNEKLISYESQLESAATDVHHLKAEVI